MSIESWKKEFYPEEAREDMSDLEAMQHALLKFDGTMEENLDKHGLKLNDGSLIDGREEFVFNADTCSLCHKYTLLNGDCEGCPLDEAGRNCNKSTSPYTSFCDDNNPYYMIDTLQSLIKM